MSFPQSRETQRAARGCAPGTPSGGRRPTGRIAFAAGCRSLHTPSRKPTALRGWRKERLAVLAVCYRSLRTLSGPLPASGQPQR